MSREIKVTFYRSLHLQDSVPANPSDLIGDEDVAVLCYKEETFYRLIQLLKHYSFMYDDDPHCRYRDKSRWRLYLINTDTIADNNFILLSEHKKIVIVKDNDEDIFYNPLVLKNLISSRFWQKSVHICDPIPIEIELIFTECLKKTVNPCDIFSPPVSDSQEKDYMHMFDLKNGIHPKAVSNSSMILPKSRTSFFPPYIPPPIGSNSYLQCYESLDDILQ